MTSRQRYNPPPRGWPLRRRDRNTPRDLEVARRTGGEATCYSWHHVVAECRSGQPRPTHAARVGLLPEEAKLNLGAHIDPAIRASPGAVRREKVRGASRGRAQAVSSASDVGVISMWNDTPSRCASRRSVV